MDYAIFAVPAFILAFSVLLIMTNWKYMERRRQEREDRTIITLNQDQCKEIIEKHFAGQIDFTTAQVVFYNGIDDSIIGRIEKTE